MPKGPKGCPSAARGLPALTLVPVGTPVDCWKSPQARSELALGKTCGSSGTPSGTVYGEATGGVARLPMRAVRAHALQHTVVNARRDEDLD